ncbi:MAG: penicillin acylase family protein [Gammaproteobacteria bacterium]
MIPRAYRSRPDHQWIVEAFRAAVKQLEDALGADPAQWQWGNLHRVRLGSVLADIPACAKELANRWKGRSGEAVSPSICRMVKLRAFVGASTRFICDLANPDEAWFAHSSGPAADPASPYFRSLGEQWLQFGYFKSALWQADEVPDVIERFVVNKKH